MQPKLKIRNSSPKMQTAHAAQDKTTTTTTTTNPAGIQAKIQTDIFQRRHPDGHRAREKMLRTTLTEMSIETSMRYHLTALRQPSSKTPTKVKCCESEGNRDSSYTVGGEGNGWVWPQGKQ